MAMALDFMRHVIPTVGKETYWEHGVNQEVYMSSVQASNIALPLY